MTDNVRAKEGAGRCISLSTPSRFFMPEQPEYQYDVFISFADSDEDWVHGYLLPALSVPKERVITGQSTNRSESFQPGAAVVNEFERAVTGSRYTLLVISRAYLVDQWSSFGEQLASYATVAEQRDRLIPLLRERDCPLPLHIEFRVRLDCTEEDKWESEIARLRELLNQPEPKPERIPCPYPGMIPFQEKDARFFYGREAEIRQMLQHFRNQRLLFVIGSSGCGKSSLVFAGLLPQLQSSPYFDEGFWLVKQMRPGPHPLQELRTVLSGDPNKESVAKLLAGNSPARRLLMAVDQFEELFNQAERSEQSGFIAALKGLRAMENCAMLITMRADFYPELMNSDLWEEVSSHRMEIAPLRGEALQEAIEKPAWDVGVYPERGLADRLMTDAAEEPGALPLLQETMRLLWAEMARRFLPLGAYERLGVGSRSGLAVAIANKADATLNDLPTAEQKVIARRIFLRLVQFGEGRPDTRRQQLVSSLRSQGDDPRLFDKTLRHMEENRLVTLTGEEKELEKKVDLAHEALITGWPQLQEWVKERRGAERTRRRLENKAEEWIRLEHKGGLLDDVEIKEAEQWLQGPDAADLGGQSSALQGLLQASGEAIQMRQQEQEASRQRELDQVRALAEERGRFADEQRQHAATAHRLALNALAMALAGQAIEIAEGRLEQNDLAALLACQAHLFSLRSGEYAASRVDQALRAVLGLPQFGGTLVSHGGVAALAFDSTGRWLASGTIDGTIEIWDLDQHDAVRSLLRGGGLAPRSSLHESACIHWLSFGSSGRSLAAIYGGAVQVWNDWRHSSLPTTIGRAMLLANNMGYPSIPPYAITSSADGAYLAYLSEGGIEVWRLPSAEFDEGAPIPDPRLSKRLAPELCRSLQFTNDGRALVVVSAVEGVVTIRNIDSPEEAVERSRPREWVVNATSRGATLIPVVALGPGGDAVAQCAKYHSSPGQTAVWILRHELEPTPNRLRDGEFWQSGSVSSREGGDFVFENPLAMQFNPDCKFLAVCQGNDIHIWDVNRPKSKSFLMRSPGVVRCLAFSPDSDVLAAGGPQVRLWRLRPKDTTSAILGRHRGGVRAVGLSPDSRTLVSCGEDQVVQIWDLGRIDVDPIVVDVRAWKGQLAFRDLKIKDASFHEREPLRVPFQIIFSRDGRFMALVITEQREEGEREALAILDFRRPEVPTILPAPLVTNSTGIHGQRRLNFYAATFGIEGHSLTTLDFDYYTFINASDSRGPIRRGFIRRWDLRGPDVVPIMVSELDGLEPMMVFSADGRFLASATNERGMSSDMALQIWDLSTFSENPTTLGKTKGTCSSIAYRNDGQVLAMGSEHGDITLWDQTRPGSSPIVLRGHRDPVSSLVFSPDGGTLASGSSDRTIRFWNLRQMRTNPVILNGHEGGVASIVFSRDGRILASGSEDGTVRLWIAQSDVLADLVREHLDRSLTQEEWSQFIGDGFESEKAELLSLFKPAAPDQ